MGHEYDTVYFLCDGMYTYWSALMKIIHKPKMIMWEKLFTKRQEAVCKEVKQAFGVLQARWCIISHQCCQHRLENMGKNMKTNMIIHNMIVGNDKDNELSLEDWAPKIGAKEVDIKPTTNKY